MAFSIAIGGTPGHVFAFPDGANVTAPAALFLTVHPNGSELVADLVQANGTPVKGPPPSVMLDQGQRQIEVDVPQTDWNPGQRTVRLTSWGPTPPAPGADVIDITAVNIATAAVDVGRAHVDCNVVLHITTDGPQAVTLPGCTRVANAG